MVVLGYQVQHLGAQDLEPTNRGNSPKFPLDGNYLFADLATAAQHCPFKDPKEIRAVKE